MDVDYCDFIVWTERDMHTKRINLDVEFWELALTKAKKFFLCAFSQSSLQNGTRDHQHLQLSFMVMKNWLMMLMVMKRKVLGVTARLT